MKESSRFEESPATTMGLHGGRYRRRRRRRRRRQECHHSHCHFSSTTSWWTILLLALLSSGSITLHSTTTTTTTTAFAPSPEHYNLQQRRISITRSGDSSFSLSKRRRSSRHWFSSSSSSPSPLPLLSYWAQQPSLHQSSFSRSLLVLWMGKGDGKKKRKKKNKTSGAASSASSSSSTSSSSEPAPLRVTTNSLVPVRRQLQYAKLNKEYTKQATPGFRQKRVVRTKYRRTWDEEEIELKAEERKRKGQDPDWDVILSRNSVNPLVIVDGYNIIYQWKRLKKHMIKGDLARARQLLIDDLENLRITKGWRIEVVFDGRRRSTVGPLGHGAASVLTSNSNTYGGSDESSQERHMPISRADQTSKASISKHGVRVVFSGIGMEADTYIESRCMQAKNVTQGALTGSFIVATDDAMIRLAGQSAGALIMSAPRFVNELKAVKEAVSYRVEAAVAKANGHAIRPEKLRGTAAATRFGRRSVLIEDKRNRTTVKQRKEQEQKLLEQYAVDIKSNNDNSTAINGDGEDENGIPWWAQVPNHTNNPYGSHQ